MGLLAATVPETEWKPNSVVSHVGLDATGGRKPDAPSGALSLMTDCAAPHESRQMVGGYSGQSEHTAYAMAQDSPATLLSSNVIASTARRLNRE